MSKTIVIEEGGVGRQLNADKLKTNLSSGGTCLWVPEDETQLGTKHITEDGTYKASDDGLYGYSEVTVSGIGTATGTGPDGETHSYQEDGEGGITDTVLPDSIAVETPPTVTTYANGATIDFRGMVVKAYLKSGEIWSDDTHPDGIIPISELIFPVTTAERDGSQSGDYWSDGQGVNAVMITYSQHWDITWDDKDRAVYADINTSVGSVDGDPIHLSGNGMAKLLVTKYNNIIYTYLVLGDDRFNYTKYDPSKKKGKFYGGGSTSYRTTQGVWTSTTTWREYLTNIPDSTSDPMQAGELSPVAVHQTIPVQLLRSDGNTLESSFDITVT